MDDDVDPDFDERLERIDKALTQELERLVMDSLEREIVAVVALNRVAAMVGAIHGPSRTAELLDALADALREAAPDEVKGGVH
jgi:hypothetical protein